MVNVSLSPKVELWLFTVHKANSVITGKEDRAGSGRPRERLGFVHLSAGCRGPVPDATLASCLPST